MSECSAAALAGHEIVLAELHSALLDSEPQGAGKHYVPTAGTRIPPAKLEISKRCPGMGHCRNEARVRTKDVEELDVVKERERQALAKALEHKVDPEFEKAHELYIQGEHAGMLTISMGGSGMRGGNDIFARFATISRPRAI